MKTITKILSLMLVLTLSISMMACSSYGKVEKALAELGYAVVEGDEADKQFSDYEDMESVTDVHVLSKTVDVGLVDIPFYVVVLEFKSTDELVEAYKESSNTFQGIIEDINENEDAKELYNQLQENGFVCGNCMILAISLDLDVYEKIAELNK